MTCWLALAAIAGYLDRRRRPRPPGRGLALDDGARGDRRALRVLPRDGDRSVVDLIAMGGDRRLSSSRC